MTIREAIDLFMKTYGDCSLEEFTDITAWSDFKLKNLNEKKKPITVEGAAQQDWVLCPGCNSQVPTPIKMEYTLENLRSYGYVLRCPRCGQSIDWKDWAKARWMIFQWKHMTMAR